ncbi:hypothetical protein VTJ49DRAFT_5259 [Mycothermus thermophilus]|uniref:Exonuclease 1 n=1 Tax=Humicola insolens TaxID=85995 RepID=A0ABR3V3P2_HUMIN
MEKALQMTCHQTSDSPDASEHSLLPLLKSIHRPTELKKYAGETLGVDGYGWLHRGAVACAIELAQGKPTRKYVDWAMFRVRMFKHFGVTPYIVFDGDFLPSKAKTEEARAKRRADSRKLGLELLRAGKPSQAYAELQKAIDVTPEMARNLIEELKKAQVPYVVAPYEADAQLVYLERQGLISGIVTEDSDLLVFGAKRLLTKMDKYGQCVEINRRDFCAVREISLTGWTDREFRHMAIFSGCDYLDGISNIGLKTAYRLIRKHKTPERVVKMIRFEGKTQVPETYLDDFRQAELTFLHQRVFCPKKQDIVFLTEPDPSLNVDEMPFIGAPVETELARAISVGDVNPITKERIAVAVPRSPGKRRISQALAPPAPPRTLGKPINEYFKDKAARRIPLGEMDPNCFNVEPDRNANPEEPPRPIVFPLPRPYVEGAEDALETPIRPYTSNARELRRRSEPISKLLGFDFSESSRNRRQTAGPSFQVYQDPSPVTRPPKKARLCDDSAMDNSSVTPEKSKFFSTKPKPKAKKKVEEFLLSDDSIEDIFNNLPEPSLGAEQPASSGAAFSQETSQETEDAPAATANHEEVEEVEVPASSPVQHGPEDRACDSNQEAASTTPLSELIKDFSYGTAQPRARIVHGLPTPASSAQMTSKSHGRIDHGPLTPASSAQTATSKPRTPANTQTPTMTPLQRIGARALRGKMGRSRELSSLRESRSLPSLPVNPAFVPLPKVDVAEVEALTQPLGSEDQLVPESDGENDGESMATLNPVRRLDLSKFRYA